MIANDILLFWTSSRHTKSTPSGWISGDAPCCVHNHNSKDTKKRGGFHLTPDNGVTFSCFNCGFKTSYHPGDGLKPKMRLLLNWIGVNQNDINKLVLKALKDQSVSITNHSTLFPSFNTVSLPINSKPAVEDTKVLEYCLSRSLDPFGLFEYDGKLLIPFYDKHHNLVGYTQRKLPDQKGPRYITNSQPGFVFNLQNQYYSKKYTFLTEGSIDALSINGIALLGISCSNQQKSLIDSLNKKIIVVPDKDESGIQLIDLALKYNWSVAFPDWDVKDPNDAVIRYGKLFTIYQILQSIESYSLKIQLKMKKWFN